MAFDSDILDVVFDLPVISIDSPIRVDVEIPKKAVRTLTFPFSCTSSAVTGNLVSSDALVLPPKVGCQGRSRPLFLIKTFVAALV